MSDWRSDPPLTPYEFKSLLIFTGCVAFFATVLVFLLTVVVTTPKKPPAPTCWCKIDPAKPEGRTMGVNGCLTFDTNEKVVYYVIQRN